MKNLEEIISQEPVYLHNWNSKFDVISDFEELYMEEESYLKLDELVLNNEYWAKNEKKVREAVSKYDDINILFATYGCENYMGDAFVLFEQDGILYEINGSHCSCYGLEGQWIPEEAVLKELEHRITQGRFGKDDYAGNTFYHEIKEFLGVE